MGNDIRCVVTGGDEIVRKLQELSPKLMRKAVKDSMKSAAKLVAETIAKYAPEDSGFLSEHIIVKAFFSRKGIATVKIGPSTEKYPNRAGKKPRG